MSCVTCKLDGEYKIQGKGSPGGLGIVGDSPGSRDIKMKQPFAGYAGKLLRLFTADTPTYMTYACLCGTKDTTQKLTPGDLAACRPRLMAELKEQNLKCLLLMGNSAVQSLLPGADNITKMRGVAVWIPELEIYAIPTYHPGAVVMNPDYYLDLESDVTNAKRVSADPTLPQPPKIDYKIVDTVPKMRELLVKVATYNREDVFFALDLETTGLDCQEDTIVAIGIAFNEEYYIIPGSVAYRHAGIRSMLSQICEDGGRWWTGHNVYQFDVLFLKYQLGITWKPRFDSMLAHYLLDERKSGHSLKALASKYFLAPAYAGDADGAVGVEEYLLTPEQIEKLYIYLANDLYYTLKLAPILREEMIVERVLDTFTKYTLPGAWALGEIELTGALINTDFLRGYSSRLQAELDADIIELMKFAGENFNPNSPKQVGELLVKKRLIHKGEATDKETLRQLGHPLADRILAYRKKSKLRSTYAEGLQEKMSADGRLRCGYSLIRTVTGRLASSKPNLQNIPVGVGIRDAFIATPGYDFVEADYSQLELRIAAYYSQDENFMSIYRDGRDVHKEAASNAMGIPYDKVTDAQRRSAKSVNFGILYGRGAKSLAENELNSTIDEAQKYIDGFLNSFPDYGAWASKMQENAIEIGMIQTPTGRKVRFPFITNHNRGEIQRRAMNNPIQSLAADICLQSIVRLHGMFDSKVARIILTVHDSILFEIKEDAVIELVPKIVEVMEDTAIDFSFPVDVKRGKTWESLEKYN